MEDKHRESSISESAAERAEDRPEIYAIRRGRSGWTLSRRNVLSATAAAAAAQSAKADVCVAGASAEFLGIEVLAVSADGRLLASAGGNFAKLWSLPNGALLKSFEGHRYGVEAAALRTDGTLLASADGDAVIRIWSLPDGTLLKTIATLGGPRPPGGAGIYAIAISPDGRVLASVGDSVKLWSLPDGTLQRTISWGGGISTGLAFSPDGKTLFAASRLWPLSDGAAPKRVSSDGPAVFSADGKLLAVAYRRGDGTVKLYSSPDGALLRTLSASGSANCVAISPDGRLLVAGTDGAGIHIWSLPDGALVKTLNPGLFGSSAVAPIFAVAVSPDGGVLISGSLGMGIQLWSLPEGKLLPVCLMDPASSNSSTKALTYTKDGTTYTVACGTPIPTGAVCSCNCVAGSAGGGGGGHYWYPN